MRHSHPFIIIHFGLITMTIVLAGCTPVNQPLDSAADLRRLGARPINLSRMAPNPETSAIPPDEPNLLLAPMGSFPNPFNPATVLSFALSGDGAMVILTIHGVDGRLARQLVATNLPAGEHAITWRGDDDNGRKLPSGIYFANLRSGGQVQVRKLVMVQ